VGAPDPMMEAAERTAAAGAGAADLEPWIKAQAYALGFDLVGIAELGPAETGQAFDDWLAAGFAGEMDYMQRTAGKRRDSRLPLPGARSAVVVGLDYGGRSPSGPVARYARGDDYHDVLLEKLRDLHSRIERRIGGGVKGKAYVDTGPLLERELARQAGLGWFGKNTNLINPRLGSYFFIGTLLLDCKLAPDTPFAEDHCGTCTRCLDACPTAAFVEPRVLDATRCISYLTIELRGEIPEELRAAIGERAYGCDVCQEVCPWNVRFARELRAPELTPRAETGESDPREWLTLDDDSFRKRFRRSPMKRAKRRGLARNAAVVAGNRRNSEDIAALTRALDDPELLVRAHAKWALGRIG
jgi:epoxyqueuosine reductase